MTENLKIPILANSYTDLSEFDFSFKGIQIMDVKTSFFANYLDSLEGNDEKWDYHEMFEEVVLQNIEEHEKYYAIVKTEPFENFNYREILAVYKLLLIIFPSDLQIQYVLEFNGYDLGMSISSWQRTYTGEYPGKILYLPDAPVSEINEFVEKVFVRMNEKGAIGYIIENYITSYEASHRHFQYLNLCFCLETIVDGRTELTYRMKRNVAILCGTSSFNSQLIFDNITKIYNLRSKIVHGDTYNEQKIEDYLPFLISIVSRTIIELLIHDIYDITAIGRLNKRITTLGFGDRHKISDDWKKFDFNIFTMTTSNWIRLQ
ncbi:HEPN domain-containing protein [Parapedobacter defluvii]|nr:HEPN domain-containing protein [Parapedobacter defluvii]